MRPLTILAICALGCCTLRAQEPEMLAEVFPAHCYGPLALFETSRGLFFCNERNEQNDDAWVLWFTDGTVAGTNSILSHNGQTKRIRPGLFFEIKSCAYFLWQTETGLECWATGGKRENTSRVFTLEGVDLYSNVENVVCGDSLYFRASTSACGLELWRTDGTKAGTSMVTDLRKGADGSSPCMLETVGGSVFFAANNGETGEELWKTDGSSAGTKLVKDIVPGKEGVTFTRIDARGGKIFAWIEISKGRHQLWVSDGTEGGTGKIEGVISHELNPGWPSELPGKMVFSLDDGVHGTEVWVSDGTQLGTFLLKDIVPGEKGSRPDSLRAAHGLVYFSVTATFDKKQLWRTDGTVKGTCRVEDVGEPAIIELAAMDADTIIVRSYPGQGTYIWRISTGGRPELINADVEKDAEFLPWRPCSEIINGRLLFFTRRSDKDKSICLRKLELGKLRDDPNQK